VERAAYAEGDSKEKEQERQQNRAPDGLALVLLNRERQGAHAPGDTNEDRHGHYVK
jgi:hypothetical protein